MWEQILYTWEDIISQPHWQYESFGNTIGAYAIALGAFIGFLILFFIFQKIIVFKLRRLAKKTKTKADDALIEIADSVRPPFYSFLAFYLAIKFLAIPELLTKIINVVLIIWVIYQIIKAVQIFIDYLVKKGLKKEGRAGSEEIIKLIGKISKGILWALGGLLILSNLGINVTSLIAGLGIGGIAIALALQNILGDLFSSFAILFDKPFIAGDFIKVGPHMGTVEKIGIKTTRIRSIEGDEVVMSNKELTTLDIKNYGEMKERRGTIEFGILYETPTSKVKKVPKIVKDIIKAEKMAKFDRTHFKKFDDSALTFEAVYYIKSNDYEKYMDLNQRILLKIKSEFEKEEIVMAYPTRTIYLAKE
ncbi:mechanosensitive ion channel family protein [Patescibacteria group bacterium]